MLKKDHWSIIIVVGLTGLVCYFLSRELAGHGHELECAFQSLNWWWLALAALAMLISVLLEGLVVRSLLAKSQRQRIRFRTLMRVPLFNMVGVGLTPFASGGQPAQLYGLAKAGVAGSRAMSVILMKFLVYQVVVVLFFIVGYVAADEFIAAHVNSTFAQVIPLTIAIHAIVIIGIIMVMFWPTITLKCVSGLQWLLVHGLRYRKGNRFADRLRQKIIAFHDESRRVAADWRAWSQAMVWTVLQLMVFYTVPYFVIRAFGYASANVWLIMAMYIMIVMVISLFPIPGGVGGAELSFQLLFTPFVHEPTTLILVILIWRIITYYAGLFAGLIAYVVPFHSPTSAESATRDSFR